MKRVEISVGEKYGKLTILKEVAPSFVCNKPRRNVLCKCDCGNIRVVGLSLLRTGHTTSCGCEQRRKASLCQTKHGLCDNELYSTWKNMKKRCSNPNDPGYKNYGGRGICVCKEWKEDYGAFYKWAINNGWKEGLSIDRIDNSGNYEPNNCRWATRIVQGNNTRKNHYIEHNGVVYTLSTFARHFNLPYNLVRYRISRCGYSVSQFLNFIRNENNKTNGRNIRPRTRS